MAHDKKIKFHPHRDDRRPSDRPNHLLLPLKEIPPATAFETLRFPSARFALNRAICKIGPTPADNKPLAPKFLIANGLRFFLANLFPGLRSPLVTRHSLPAPPQSPLTPAFLIETLGLEICLSSINAIHPRFLIETNRAFRKAISPPDFATPPLSRARFFISRYNLGSFAHRK